MESLWSQEGNLTTKSQTSQAPTWTPTERSRVSISPFIRWIWRRSLYASIHPPKPSRSKATIFLKNRSSRSTRLSTRWSRTALKRKWWASVLTSYRNLKFWNLRNSKVTTPMPRSQRPPKIIRFSSMIFQRLKTWREQTSNNLKILHKMTRIPKLPQRWIQKQLKLQGRPSSNRSGTWWTKRVGCRHHKRPQKSTLLKILSLAYSSKASPRKLWFTSMPTARMSLWLSLSWIRSSKNSKSTSFAWSILATAFTKTKVSEAMVGSNKEPNRYFKTQRRFTILYGKAVIWQTRTS